MPDDGPTQEKILKEYDRLGPDDSIQFRCGKDLDCFTCCCQDVSIVSHPLRRAADETVPGHLLL